MKHIQINLNVLIHKVKLQVRFPCSLLAFLKVQNEEIPFGSEVPLRVGEAYLELSASSRFSLYFDATKNTFSEKKISICIYLSTSSGRIPAGSASIHTNLLKKGNNKVSLNIEKCPDKNAYIEASITYQLLNEIQFIQSSEHIPEIPPPQENFNNRINKVNAGQKSRPRIYEAISSGMSSPKGSQGSELKKSVDKIQQLKKSKASNGNYQFEMEQSSFSKKKPDEKSERQHSTYSPSNDYTSKIKLGQLEKQLKNVQRKYEQSVMDLKAANSKKDILERSLKEAEGQLKMYKQKYEDSQQTNENLQKRFDYKEGSYKQQIKNLTEKLTASENQRQQMIFAKNDSVTEFEEREKTLRLTIREKEKQLTDERNRLAKKNQQIIKELAEMQAKAGQNELKFAELARDSTGLVKQNQLLEDRCRGLLSQIEQLKQSHSQQKSKRQELEETLGNNLELEDEKKKLKKKITEQEQEINKQLKNVALLESNYQKQIKKTQESELNLKQKSNTLKNLQKDYENLLKEIEHFKKIIDEKQKKIEELSNLKQGQTSKIEVLAEQLRQQQKKTSDQIKNLKKQLKDREARIQNLCKESEDQVDTIHDYNNRIESLQVELDQKNAKFLKLQKDYEEVLKNKSILEQEVIELQVNISSEKTSKEELEITLKNQLKDKDESISKFEQTVKKLQNSSSQREEEDAHNIYLLEKKIANYQNETKENLAQIEKLRSDIKTLETIKTQGLASLEELQFTIKIKNNEIAFLKETAQKNHQQINELTCENKEMSVTIQKLSDHQVQLEVQIDSLNNRLNEAHQNGSGVQEQLNNYIASNNEKIAAYLNTFLSGSKIQFSPIHQEAEIQQLMCAAIKKVNEVYSFYQESMKKLEGELEVERSESNQLRLQVEVRLQEYEDLRNNLEDELARHHENNQQSDGIIKELKTQLQSHKQQILNFESELASLKEVNSTLAEELETVNSALENKSDENSTLKLNLQQLEEQFKSQERQFSMTQSRQSNKFQQEASSLKQIIIGLQEQAKIEANKYAELTSKFNDKIKQYKQLQRKTSEQIKRLGNENDKLNAQVAKQYKQIEAKASLNMRYSEIETDLRGKLQQANKDNAALKELNETIRKRNEKAAQKQRQQEEAIANLKNGQSQLNNKQSDLEKALKERTAQFVASREQNYQLEKEKQKLIQDIEIANALIKVKEEGQKKLEASVKNLESEKIAFKEKIKALETSSLENEKKNQKQILSLNETKSKNDKQLEETRIKLEAAQNEILNLSKNSQEATKQFGEQIKQLKSKNKELEDKIVLAAKNLADQEKAHSTEDQYLKPVRDNMQLLRGHMAEYNRASDQFESNKNKLLKIATTKADLPTDKYVGERMREVSFAYNKLKVFILGCELSEPAKNQAGEEIKKVQLALDRVLRGEK